jgi:hypothetical protein
MYPIKIRADHANGAELDFAAAVQAAMAKGDERTARIIVTAVYAEDTKVGSRYGDARDIASRNTPVFGLDAEIMCRRIKYGENDDATVSIAGIQSHSPEVAMIRAQCYLLAAQIAAAANAAAAATA